MTGVILQPASGKEAQDNYRKTIDPPVDYTRIQSHVSASFLEKMKLSVTGNGICVWGAIPGNESRWDRILIGDVVLFYRDGRFFSRSEVVAKIHSWPLANDLWDSNEDGSRWEFVLFLTPPSPLDIHHSKIGEPLGFKSSSSYRRLNPLREGESQIILDVLAKEEASTEYYSAFNQIDAQGSLDTASTVMVRREQAALRKMLLGTGSEAVCGICERPLPVRYLVAAHIKQRSECTLEEKSDIPSIAMPVCTIGCDAFYEAGLVTVDEGVVQVASTWSATLSDILDGLRGKQCRYWNSAREPYFAWHRGNRYKG